MVIQRYYIKNKGEHFWIALGISLINVSIGLSIAIARTDSLSFGHKGNSLTLTKKAIKLSNEADKLEELATEIAKKSRGKKAKSEVNRIADELKSTKQQIGDIVEDKIEEKTEDGNI